MGGVRGIVVFLGRELYCVVWVCVSDGRTDGRTERQRDVFFFSLPSVVAAASSRTLMVE